MAKVKGPLFSLQASGSFGQLVFDRRGYVRFKGSRAAMPKAAARATFGRR